MKTKEEILKAVENGKKSESLDSRDFERLSDYFSVSEWKAFGFSLKEGQEAPKVKEWTKENILKDLKEDLDFGFDKVLGQRGLSAGAMNDVVKMWMWVLNDELQYHSDYAQYGLPLLKAVALKYDLKNEIGEDVGNENKYACTY